MPILSTRSAAPCAALLVALLACGPGEAPPPPVFRAALVTMGPVDDGGWNAAAYEGLLRVRDELEAQVDNFESRDGEQAEERFRAYAREGYQLVFSHGPGYEDEAARVASVFPDTIFVNTSGDTLRVNVAPMIFELEQATYLCGVLAARMSETQVLGMIGGVDEPRVRSAFAAFRTGARNTSPGITVRQAFTGSNRDAVATRDTARDLAGQNADLFLTFAGEADAGVFEALSERAAEGKMAFAFSAPTDRTGQAPEIVLASATLDVALGFTEVARRVKARRFRSESMRMGMDEGVVTFVLNPALEGQVPPDVRQYLADIQNQVRSHVIRVPRLRF